VIHNVFMFFILLFLKVLGTLGSAILHVLGILLFGTSLLHHSLSVFHVIGLIEIESLGKVACLFWEVDMTMDSVEVGSTNRSE